MRLSKDELATAAVMLHRHAMTDASEQLAMKFAAELLRRDNAEYARLRASGSVYPVES